MTRQDWLIFFCLYYMSLLIEYYDHYRKNDKLNILNHCNTFMNYLRSDLLEEEDDEIIVG